MHVCARVCIRCTFMGMCVLFGHPLCEAETFQTNLDARWLEARLRLRGNGTHDLPAFTGFECC